MSFIRSLPLMAAVTFAPGAQADVAHVRPAGVEVGFAMHVAYSPAKLYAGLAIPAQGWSSEHTYSQNVANLTLDPKAGGCFCETPADGTSFEHMHTVTPASC